MQKIILTISFACSMSFCVGQSARNKSLTDSLQYIAADTLDCKATTYWQIVAYGKEAIPYLIKKLTDTTSTRIRVRCKSSSLNVGEVAYFALQEIVRLPVFVITDIQFDYADNNGCWSFYDYLFNKGNKLPLQQKLQQWYAGNQSKLKQKNIPARLLTDCQKKYGIRGYWEWTN